MAADLRALPLSSTTGHDRPRGPRRDPIPALALAPRLLQTHSAACFAQDSAAKVGRLCRTRSPGEPEVSAPGECARRYNNPDASYLPSTRKRYFSSPLSTHSSLAQRRPSPPPLAQLLASHAAGAYNRTSHLARHRVPSRTRTSTGGCKDKRIRRIRFLRLSRRRIAILQPKANKQSPTLATGKPRR